MGFQLAFDGLSCLDMARLPPRRVAWAVPWFLVPFAMGAGGKLQGWTLNSKTPRSRAAQRWPGCAPELQPGAWVSRSSSSSPASWPTRRWCEPTSTPSRTASTAASCATRQLKGHETYVQDLVISGDDEVVSVDNDGVLLRWQL